MKKNSLMLVLFPLHIALTSTLAYARTYEISWMPESQNDTFNRDGAIRLQNQLLLEDDRFPNLIAIASSKTGELNFEINGISIMIERLGTPISTDNSYLLPSIFINQKYGQVFCIEKSFNESHLYLKYYHNNYVIYKIQNEWRSLYFYSSQSCKKSVRFSNNKLNIQYDVLDGKKRGILIKKLRAVTEQGEINDTQLSEKHDPIVEKFYNELLPKWATLKVHAFGEKF